MGPEDRRYFEERQAFAAFVYWIIVAVCLLVCATFVEARLGWAARVPPIVILMLTANILYEETIVTGRDVRVRFGYAFPFYVRSIPLVEIEVAEPVVYSPLAEYGGWGIRGFGSNVALNARGNQGVRMELTRGRRLLIGSQRPDELAAAIRDAKLGR